MEVCQMAAKIVDYSTSQEKATGFIVEPANDERRPALIVIHEWWGLNDHTKDIAGRFAAEGFVPLAPDLYDGVSAKDPAEAGRLMQALDQQRALAKLDAAVEYLNKHTAVDSTRIGITGFCMGGTYALRFPCHNKAIKAAAPFYGDVPPDDVLKDLAAPVLFIGADQDQWITTDKMESLRAALARLGKEGEVKIYQGVGHAFFNDTRPEAYNKDAAEDAWKRVLKFFREHL